MSDWRGDEEEAGAMTKVLGAAYSALNRDCFVEPTPRAAVHDLIRRARAAERERCALVAAGAPSGTPRHVIANDIRALGEGANE